MQPNIIIIIAVVAWGAAMLRMLPRAWRLDKNRKRRSKAGKRLSIGELELRGLRLEQA